MSYNKCVCNLRGTGGKEEDGLFIEDSRRVDSLFRPQSISNQIQDTGIELEDLILCAVSFRLGHVPDSTETHFARD